MMVTAGETGYTLLTGATGLVGSMLMRDLLRNGKRVAVLVRPKRRQTAAERIESILQFWELRLGERLARPVCVTGDVNSESLGLDAHDQQWLVRHCCRVIHNAAVVEFSATSDKEEPWKTNLGGTRRTLELCRKLGLREFHYMSTAYVCGKREGVIQESQLEMSQGFRNDYEHSKYLAEKLVRTDNYIAPATIYRPVVIGGDSQTGFTNTYHGINVYLRLLHVLMTNTKPDRDGRRHVPLRIALDGTERRNVVTVDWVSETVCRLLDNPAARGRTFHLAPRQPITTREFFDAAYRFFNAHGYEFCGRSWEIAEDKTLSEEAFLAHRAPYEDYEHTDPRFDRTNLDRYAQGLTCQKIDETVLRRYLSFGAEDQWGKRPQQRADVSIWAEPLLRQILADSLRQWPALTQSSTAFGLDIVGAGGGQWQLTFEPSKPPSIHPGLPPDTQPVFRLSVDKLTRLLGVSVAKDSHDSDPNSQVVSLPQVRRNQRLLQRLASYLAKDGLSGTPRRQAG
jgi:thioester reductase-like protein